jgi:hypothetical protein
MKHDACSISSRNPGDGDQSKCSTAALMVFDGTHELSNHLTILLGSAEMLQIHILDSTAADTTLDTKQVAERARAVLSSANHCAELLEQMRSICMELTHSPAKAELAHRW